MRSDSSALDVGVSDRYIPSRATSCFTFNLWDAASASGYSSAPRGAAGSDASGAASAAASAGPGSVPDSSSAPARSGAAPVDPADLDEPEEPGYSPATTGSASQQGLLNTLLRSELLGENDAPPSAQHLAGPGGFGAGGAFGSGPRGAPSHSAAAAAPLLRDGANCLRYVSPRQLYQDGLLALGEYRSGGGAPASAASRMAATHPSAVVNSFSLTAVGSATSQRLMSAPPKRKRRISKVPFKVLDAPALQDDFYLNLVDWSSLNVLAVGLGSCVYLWSACTSKVTKLCDLAASEDLVTSVSWAQRGTHLAVGTNRGEVQLWDTVSGKIVRSMHGHSARVGALAWSGPILASGSRDRLIYLRDVRAESAFTEKMCNHKQEVCGLKWSFDEPSFLASGGNDNHLHVIDPRQTLTPVFEFADHTAAVKAIAWSPHQHGLLASGGGTADRCIRFWNTLSGASLSKVDTGSQVCNLAWSQNCNELVSTHGYSLNQIVVWRYPSMSKVTTLTGHTYRVLYLSMSPDGSTIVTGAGDETLRFWQVFPGPRADGKEGSSSLLFPKTLGSVIR
jgi:cell division cycle 20-like protein 1 (cofactor of APC complex)